MINSFDDFRNAVLVSLKDKVAERIATERQRVSNNLFAAVTEPLGDEDAHSSEEESQSNAEEN